LVSTASKVHSQEYDIDNQEFSIFMKRSKSMGQQYEKLVYQTLSLVKFPRDCESKALLLINHLYKM
jgi:hypothetical protein